MSKTKTQKEKGAQFPTRKNPASFPVDRKGGGEISTIYVKNWRGGGAPQQPDHRRKGFIFRGRGGEKKKKGGGTTPPQNKKGREGKGRPCTPLSQKKTEGKEEAK